MWNWWYSGTSELSECAYRGTCPRFQFRPFIYMNVTNFGHKNRVTLTKLTFYWRSLPWNRSTYSWVQYVQRVRKFFQECSSTIRRILIKFWAPDYRALKTRSGLDMRFQCTRYCQIPCRLMKGSFVECLSSLILVMYLSTSCSSTPLLPRYWFIVSVWWIII